MEAAAPGIGYPKFRPSDSGSEHFGQRLGTLRTAGIRSGVLRIAGNEPIIDWNIFSIYFVLKKYGYI